MSAAKPRLSVIVPVWNGPVAISRCLAAIDRQTYPRDHFEVLVVDNGSTDSTVQAISSFSFARLLSEPRPGSYRARNLGIENARGDYVIFTDSDCVPDVGWLAAAAMAVARHPGAGIYAGRIELFQEGRGGAGSAGARYELLFAFDQAAYAKSGKCATANWMSPREALVAVGGFDGNLKSGGDMELSRRMGRSGCKVVYVPEMLVRHPTRGDLSELARKRRRVVGGIWMKREPPVGIASLLWSFLRQCAAQLRTIFRTPRIAPGMRLQLAGIAVHLLALSIVELVRVASGGDPARQ